MHMGWMGTCMCVGPWMCVRDACMGMDLCRYMCTYMGVATIEAEEANASSLLLKLVTLNKSTLRL